MHRHAEIGRRTLKVIVITFVLLTFQSVFAVLTGSISLWSDTVHVGSDLVALGILWLAQLLALRSHTNGDDHFEGYHMVELSATGINGILLIFAGGVLATQAFSRLSDPPEISGIILFPGIIGLVVNIGMIFLLIGERQHLTVQSAISHVSFDSLASVGVIAAGILIFSTGKELIDPIISLFIITLIVSWGVRLIWLARTTEIRQRKNTDV